MSEEGTESGVFLEKDSQATKDKVKLPTLKGTASREGIPFYIVPLPACRQAGTLP